MKSLKEVSKMVWRRRGFPDFDRLFDEMLRFREEINRWLEDFMGEFPETVTTPRLAGIKEPLLDMYEDENEIIVTMELPGINKEDIKLRIRDNVLEISADVKREDKYKDKNVLRMERRATKFYRRIVLPAQVDTKKAKATYNNGILEVRLPKLKKEEEKGEEIKIE